MVLATALITKKQFLSFAVLGRNPILAIAAFKIV